MNACKEGNVLELKQSIHEGADIHQWEKQKGPNEKWDKRKWTPLIYACCNGHTECVRVLIANHVLKPYLRE